MLKTRAMGMSFGILMIFLGAIIASPIVPILGSTLIVDTTPPVITQVSFSSIALSDSPSAPAIIPAGTNSYISVFATDASGVKSGTVRVTGPNSYDSGVLTLDAYYKVSWISPTAAGTYNFAVTVSDGTNATSKTYYGSITASATPTGYFQVNGIKIQTITDKIYLATRDIKFKFTATTGGDSITSVTVQIQDSSGNILPTSTLTETTADSIWESSYKFSKDDSYTVKGFIDIGSTRYQLMSVLTDSGVQPFSLPPLNVVAGLTMMFFGFIMTAVSFSRKK